MALPAGASITLLNGATPVTSLTVPDQGTYRLDPTTGTITFTPVAGFTGTATAVTYQLTDAYGQTATARYTATVTAPVTPPVRPGPAQPASPATPHQPNQTGGGTPTSVPAGNGGLAVNHHDATRPTSTLLGGLLLTAAGALGLTRRPRPRRRR